MNRAIFLSFCALCLSAGAGHAQALVQKTPPQRLPKTTYTYKKVGDLEIKADVYRPADDKVRPVVVHIHGGALMGGNRENIGLGSKLVAAGYVVVSIDYRLAPETKLPDLINDVEDAFKWVRQSGPKLFKADPEQLVVMGGSAGGYLTLVCGYRVKPRPRALVSNFGYGDLIGPWLTQPSKYHKSKLTREEAYKLVSGPPVTDPSQRLKPSGFYPYCRQQGVWPREVSGWDPFKEADKFTPYLPVKNVTSDYPPTLLIHGTADTDVPFEQSVLMKAEFEKHGVEHRLMEIKGAEHGFFGADAKTIAEINRTTMEFIQKHVPVR